MAPHSSTLAWKMPWMEEPGRLQSMVDVLSMVLYRRRSFETTVKVRQITGSKKFKEMLVCEEKET